MYTRRLPIYFLLDCSESMAGWPIEAVSIGVNTIVDELKTNPLALETAYLGVITFSRDAQLTVPLTELMLFQPPKLNVRPGTSLGGALALLMQCLERDVVRTTETTKGDYRPLVFLITDGQPTDNWEIASDTLRKIGGTRPANIYAVGCGVDVDVRILHRITDIVIHMPNLTPEGIRKLFMWLSASIQTASASLRNSGGTEPIKLPPLPDDVLEVATKFQTPARSKPSQVFLHAVCSRCKKPYLMRFKFEDRDELYYAVASHPLETLEEDDGKYLPPINSSLLRGCPSCPHCENSRCTMCPCGTLFCTPSESPNILICPICDKELVKIGSGDFDIKRSEG